MVQTYQSPVRVYKHPFELVMAAYEKRFPTCPQIPIFVGSEITYEHKSDDGAEEMVERKCQLNVDAPYLLKKIIGVDYLLFTQRNSLDRRKRTLFIEATNISFSNRVEVNETCQYYVHAENPEWTCFEQNASLDVKSFFGFESAVEKLAVKHYSHNLAKGKEILEYFIDEMIKGGITYIPPHPTALGGVTADGGVEMHNASTLLSTCEEVPGGEVDHSSTSNTTKSPSDSAIDVSHHERGEEETAAGAELPSLEKSAELPSAVAGGKFPLERKKSSQAAGQQQTPTRSLGGDEHGRRKSSNFQTTKKVSQMGHASGEGGRRTSSFDESEPKLEEEFIHRCLGPLTINEESRLCELKYGLQAEHKGKLPNDAHILRFLRARDFDVKKASRMLLDSLLWRKQHDVDKLLKEYVPPPVLLRYFPGGWHHADLEGRPMFVLRLGQMDVKGLLRALGVEELLKFIMWICEQGIARAAEATQRLGKPIGTICLLVDLDGLSMRHLWRPGVQALLRIIEVMEAHYPETLGLVLVTRAPRIFPVLWTLISTFIVENTRRKFMINSDTNSQLLTELEKFIAAVDIPQFLGGKAPLECECIEMGAHVPKSEYKVAAISSDDDILTSNYTVATAHRGVPYEICVPVKDVGCVLTWDFDVIKGECDFVLYYSPRTIRPPPGHAPSPSASAHFNPVELVIEGASSLFSSSSSTPAGHHQSPTVVIVAEPELKLGAELTVCEQPGLFFEGDSMQGSHYCKEAGTYILQWRYVEAPTSSSNHQSTPFVDFSSHKCKLMVHHQLLNSVDFRGSVASLESCRSSFSSLAAALGGAQLSEMNDATPKASMTQHKS